MRTTLLRSAALAALAGSALLVSACRDRQEAAENDEINAAGDFSFDGMNDQSALEMAGEQEENGAGNATEPSPVVANTIEAPTPPGAPGGDTGGNSGDDDPSGM